MYKSVSSIAAKRTKFRLSIALRQDQYGWIETKNIFDEQARQGALHQLMHLFRVPCSISLLALRVHSSLYAVGKCTLSSKFFGTQVS